MEEEIRYLKPEEKEKARALWSQAFFEDSEEFDNYYFTEKIKENQILVKEEDGRIISMVHLNPYKIRLKKQVCEINYVVGVATDKDRRHKGHMKDLLSRMLQDGWKKGEPFTFLMPADKAIYEPFGFRFIYDKAKGERKDLTDMGITEKHQAAAELIEDDEKLNQTACFMEQWLSRRFQVFSIRDRVYVKNLMKELASEDGQITFFFKEDSQSEESLEGIQAVWGLEEKEQRFLYVPDEWMGEQRFQPAIMGRIVNLKRFLSLFSLKEQEESSLEVMLDVQDLLIPENNGLWRWKLTGERAEAEKIGDRENIENQEKTGGKGKDGCTEVFHCSVCQLLQWLMGYRSFKTVFSEQNQPPFWHEKINIFQGIFLDEEV